MDGMSIEMGRASCTALACLAVLAQPAARAAEPTPSPSPPLFARCEAEAKVRFRTAPLTDKLTKVGLKKVRGSKPAYPDLPQGTRGKGIAVHEVLVGPDGNVQAVWPIREPALDPAFPAFAEAIVDALQTWEYEPFRASGHPVPVCIVVTTTIHWQ